MFVVAMVCVVAVAAFALGILVGAGLNEAPRPEPTGPRAGRS